MTPRQIRRGQRGRRLRRGRRWPAVVLAAGLLGTGIAPAAAEPTTAFWTDPEMGTPTLKAGTVLPAASLTCTPGVAAATFRWTLPAGGLVRTNWSWTYQPPLLPLKSGQLGAGITSVKVAIIAGVDQPFTLRAIGPSGWTSKVWTARVTSLVVGGVSCVIVPPSG